MINMACIDWEILKFHVNHCMSDLQERWHCMSDISAYFGLSSFENASHVNHQLVVVELQHILSEKESFFNFPCKKKGF